MSTMNSHDDSGTITLWLLGVCLLVFALGGISLDLWRGFSARRSLATAADAAALAGASAIDEAVYRTSGVVQLDPALAESRARAHVVRQLDVGALRTVDVRADQEAVTVVVRGEIGFTLLGVVDPGGALAVRVTATATPRRAG
jgi:Flp pilus assembly protein TadG